MKKLSKNKLGLRKEAIRVLQDAMLENARGGVPDTEGTICVSDSRAPCTRSYHTVC